MINGSIVVRNVSNDDCKIEIAASCACTVADDQEFSLPRGADHEVTFAISTYGRVGPFFSSVSVKSEHGAVTVPIKAVFLPQVLSLPSRVLLLPDADILVGEFLLEAPAEVWPTLKLEFDISELDVQEISKDGNKRRYRVTATTSLKTYGPLRVKKHSQELPMLTIPVVNGFPKMN